MLDILSNPIVAFCVVPLLIFIARIIDVSLGTVRVILANKGIKKLAAFIGFFEVLIWLIAITTIMQHLDNFLSYLAYATGFALGTYVGVVLEDKISIGQVQLKIISKKNLKGIIEDLRPTKYVFISNNVDSSHGKIKIINAFIERKYLKSVLAKIKQHDKDAFYTVEDLKMIKEEEQIKKPFFFLRKGK